MIADSESVGPMVCLPVAPKLIASLLKAVFVFHFLQKAASDFLQAEINVLALLPCHYVHTSAILCLHLHPSCKPLQGKDFPAPQPHLYFYHVSYIVPYLYWPPCMFFFFFKLNFQSNLSQGRENTRVLATYFVFIYVVFNNVSRERLVGESSSPVFFCLDLGVKRVGKQLCFCGTNGKPTLLPLSVTCPWGLGRQPG